MAFVKDGVFNNFQNEVIQNYGDLEKRVDELEALLKKSTGGVTVDAVAPEPTPEPEPVQEEPVVEKEVTDEYGQPLPEEKEEKAPSSSKSKKKK
jgi:hypothetical protein|tara:strand:+ start:2250 stop:2531 length:282 start_codon:yes stop_codon:yes gene_type:complete